MAAYVVLFSGVLLVTTVEDHDFLCPRLSCLILVRMDRIDDRCEDKREDGAPVLDQSGRSLWALVLRFRAVRLWASYWVHWVSSLSSS